MARLWLTIITIILFFLGFAGKFCFELMAAGAHASGGGPYHDSGNSGIITYSLILGVVYILLLIVLGEKDTKENDIDE